MALPELGNRQPVTFPLHTLISFTPSQTLAGTIVVFTTAGTVRVLENVQAIERLLREQLYCHGAAE